MSGEYVMQDCLLSFRHFLRVRELYNGVVVNLLRANVVGNFKGFSALVVSRLKNKSVDVPCAH